MGRNWWEGTGGNELGGKELVKRLGGNELVGRNWWEGTCWE